MNNKKRLFLCASKMVICIITIIISSTLIESKGYTIKTELINEKTLPIEQIINKDEEIVYTEEEQNNIEEFKEVVQEQNNNQISVVETNYQQPVVNDPITNIRNDYSNTGTYGRLYVSYYNVALYDYNVNTTSSQSLQTLVDNQDSAAYYYNVGRKVIADHNYQGFKVLITLNPGDKAYIKLSDGNILTYRLIYKSKGYNTGPDLIDINNNSFYNMSSDLIMYTCYEDGIMGTLWVLE